jgi:hypothetical protein
MDVALSVCETYVLGGRSHLLQLLTHIAYESCALLQKQLAVKEC